MNIGADNHMKTFPSGMLFGLVARNFRKLVGREVEAVSLAIGRTFAYS